MASAAEKPDSGHAPDAGSRTFGARNDEEARQISARNQAAHKEAIKAVAERNEKAHQEAKKIRQANDRRAARLRREYEDSLPHPTPRGQ